VDLEWRTRLGNTPVLETRSRRDYFDAALAILSERGPEALTIAALCDRLGVSKGSFYHHFRGMPGFVENLLEHWEVEHNQRLIDLSNSEADPVRRVDLLRAIAAGLPHGAEAAIRAWGRNNNVVAGALTRVDGRREQHITDSLVLLGVTPVRARRLARAALAMLVGTQQMQRPVDRAALSAMLAEFNQQVLGVGRPTELEELRKADHPRSRSRRRSA
jgi:AcrR family transcriptional regulator